MLGSQIILKDSLKDSIQGQLIIGNRRVSIYLPKTGIVDRKVPVIAQTKQKMYIHVSHYKYKYGICHPIALPQHNSLAKSIGYTPLGVRCGTKN